MTQNPFEAPRAQDTQAPPSQQGTGSFDIGTSLSEAWAAVSSNFGLAIGGTLLMGIAMMVSYVTIIGIIVLIPVLAWGGVKFYLNFFDGNAEIGDLFSGFKSFGAALGSVLLLGVCIFAVYIPGYLVVGIGAAMESGAVSALGNLIVMIIGFLVVIRLYFAIFFVVDQNMGAIDALKASWEATSEQKLGVVILGFVAGLVAMAGFLALGVGALVSIPVSYLMYVSAYRQMVGRP